MVHPRSGMESAQTHDLPHSLGFLLKVGEEWFWRKKLPVPESLKSSISALIEARAE